MTLQKAAENHGGLPKDPRKTANDHAEKRGRFAEDEYGRQVHFISSLPHIEVQLFKSDSINCANFLSIYFYKMARIIEEFLLTSSRAPPRGY